MLKIRRKLRTAVMRVAAALIVAAPLCSAVESKPPRIAQSQGRTFLDSQITLGSDYRAIVNKSFVSTPVMQLKRGMRLPSRALIGPLGMDRMVSLRRHNFVIGSRPIAYPVVGLMRCSNFPNTGSFVRVIASTTVMRVDVGPQPLPSGAFVIEAARDIKARESIPSLRIHFQENNFIFSVEEAPASALKPLPTLSIVPAGASEGDRQIALEAWRLSNQSVREGIFK